jgi:SGNH domain (fused to AT3 domains)
LKHPIRQIAALWLVAAVVLTGAAAAASSSSKPASSSGSVASALTAALKVKLLPPKLTPSLQAISAQGLTPFVGVSWLTPSCSPLVHTGDATHPVPCWFGDKSAKRTIVLFGDSFVGSWLPALSDVAKSLRYRLAAFEFSGCITPFEGMVATPSFPEADVALCNDWHANLPASVKKLKPSAVIAVNGYPDQGPAGDPAWVSAMALAFQELTAGSKAHRIIIGTGPHFAVAAPECLAANTTDIQNCTLRYKPTASDPFGAALLRDKAMSKASKATLVPTVQWFCASDKCPTVVGNKLLYVDYDHATIVYSEYLSTVLRLALSKNL